ncbi:MAG TPA: sialidase family protein [Gaiellaceae bacterium]|jgi:hypothetical protein|nr:sialidase family protein [Gaiellaceae bacterium]
MSKRVRIVVAVLLVAAVATGLALIAGSSGSRSLEGEGHEGQGGSSAILRHEDAFGVAEREGPGSYADQVAELNAYPADSITAEQIASAQAAFTDNQGNGYGKGKHSTTSWYSLGPNNAVYPASLNRHGSNYVSSGRITALTISPTCDKSRCTVWVGAAGGGVWRTDKALSGNPGWQNVSDGSFASGAIGSLTYDAAHNTLYAGTGEDAAAGDAEAGVGIYKSTDGGDTWTALGGNSNFTFRAIRQISVDKNDPTGKTIYVADGRGVHGISSTTAGAVSQIPGGPGVGVWKSTDGGATFTLLQPTTVVLGPLPGQTFPSSFGSTRGATAVELDPTHPGVVYATAYQKGVWRSTDNGATWTNIHVGFGSSSDRSEFALATLPNGDTRMYQTEGDSGPPKDTDGHVHGDLLYSRFFIANGVQAGSPTFTDMTSAGLTFHTDAGGNIVADPSSPGYATYNFCTGQCWYDQGVYSPPSRPNMVYVYGSFVYGEAPDLGQDGFRTQGGVSNGRAVLLSTDGGNTFTDLTEDASSTTAPQGLHPDQHALVTNPSNPLQFFEGSDGGLMLSDGTLADISSRCDLRGLSGGDLARCKQLLSAVPGSYSPLNVGLQTLQFQSLSVNPNDSKNVQGGTQDNGTFETQGSVTTWPQTIFGDGGLSGFDPTNTHFRFHTYFSQQPEVSFRDGTPSSWNFIGDPLFAESALFYFPIISDPIVSGTLYSGLNHVWRTLDDGGPQAYLEQHCNEFTGDGPDVNPHPTSNAVCGDWVKLGDPSLTSAGRGTRSGGNVSWVARTPQNAGTLWASTTTGRVFVSTNANSVDPAAVTFTRLDTLASNSPNRAISSIYVDPANPNHAWISYLGYNDTTPATPGHVFEVTYTPAAGTAPATATWTMLDNVGTGGVGNQPVNGVVYDKNTGDLYAATDFGVIRLAADDTASGWVMAAKNLPIVTVAGLTINPDARQLLAATHGRGAYQLTLP